VFRKLDRWLERVSGGAGPVGHWMWAALVAGCVVGLVCLLTRGVQ
jgi:hypothetical protein